MSENVPIRHVVRCMGNIYREARLQRSESGRSARFSGVDRYATYALCEAMRMNVGRQLDNDRYCEVNGTGGNGCKPVCLLKL
ncbi:hypothetical protein QFZ94_002673 [Paraburkholderia sp. JPY465]